MSTVWGRQAESACAGPLAKYDFELPPEQIAQEPAPRRDASRLVVVERHGGEHWDLNFAGVARFLMPGDVLVLNDTMVIPARLRARRESGGAAELLLVEAAPGAADGGVWYALGKPAKAFRPGRSLALREAPGVRVTALGREANAFLVRFEKDGRALAPDEVVALSLEIGETPLPPYIRRPAGHPGMRRDRERYQTVYARSPGAVAAPTAGLHFTRELLDRLIASGVEVLRVTLHVGLDTFRPLEKDAFETGKLYGERVEITAPAADALLAAREEGRRIIAVGTTTARALESFREAGFPRPYRSRTHLFIRPPYEFQMLDGLLTNFHLPRTSLLLMVAALAGRDRILAVYREAIAREYRFYSYGDAMLIL